MKLHVTITNENGTTVSKGGNKSITIELKYKNKIIGIIAFDEWGGNNEVTGLFYALNIYKNKRMVDGTSIPLPQGKKQKDKCSNGYTLPCETCPKDGMGKCVELTL